MKYGFGKDEKLKSRKEIEELFKSGSSLKQYPILVISRKQAEINGNRAAFTVSSKKFKKASDRNRIKRLMRETYRLQKHQLPENGINMMFIYMPGEILPYDQLHKSMGKLLEKLKIAQHLQSQ